LQSKQPSRLKSAKLYKVCFFAYRRLLRKFNINVIIDLLKLSDETDLDILNHSMEVMVKCFQTELLPVAAQLAARLVRGWLMLRQENHQC
jgi:hypothetical protein